ncbi:DUF1622 domain-containing protein [Listeria sp. FSL L7-1582]|uniref:DUF1622 domain-containing protein n=1 Tax=Listeria portnoyi TaxID=2713504 RepID=UPI00164DBA5E|nr:DUF1622 domain-containing protein [Listeria portnoyi]MBC6310189.1 DUF1622 domain-containing protein [Listeria portnoyi]
MNFFYPFFEIITQGLDILAMLLLLLGVVLCIVKVIRLTLRRTPNLKKAIFKTKNDLSSYILFSLEILIVSDIIESILKPTIQDLFSLALIVIIRTVISYFLNLELEQDENEA